MSLPEYDPSNETVTPHPNCVRGVVGVAERDGRLLLIKRGPHVRAPGAWCFPGGHIETDESPAEAIVREFREEVGLVVEAQRRLWSWLREDGRLHLEWWHVEIIGGELQPNPHEVADARWMTDDEIRAHPGTIVHNVTFLDLYRAGRL